MVGFYEEVTDYRRRLVNRNVVSSPEEAQERVTGGDVFSAVRKSFATEDTTGGVHRFTEKAIYDQMEAIGEVDPEFKYYNIPSSGSIRSSQLAHATAGIQNINKDSPNATWYKSQSERIKQLNKEHGTNFLTWEELEPKTIADINSMFKRAEHAKATASPHDAFWGGLGGVAVGALQDPIIAGSMFLSWPLTAAKAAHLGTAGKIFHGMKTDAAIFGGIEAAIIQPHVYFQKDALGRDYTIGHAAMVTLMVSGGAAGFRGILEGAGMSAKALYRTLRDTHTKEEAAAVIRDTGNQLNAAGETKTAEVMWQWADAVGETPRGWEIGPDGTITITVRPSDELLHVRNLDIAWDNLERGFVEPFEAPTVAMPVKPEHQPIHLGDAPEPVRVDPREIKVDAKTFQFKEGGDAAGVTARLKGVSEWDEVSAGVIIVFENKAGERFVVDGHQRVGLANRLIEEGADPDTIRIGARIYREVDGYTQREVRIRAAITNIQQDTGSILDVAKVMREMGDRYNSVLPPNSALVRDGRNMARLDDDAFQYAANALKPKEHRLAAVVGELIPQGPGQIAALQALVRSKPANRLQARMITEQIKVAGFQRVETQDLFGGMTLSETLFKERAQVLENSLRLLKQNRSLLRTVLDRDAELTGLGNRMNREANLERFGEDDTAIEALSRLANTKGPISEALNKAAQRIKNGENVGLVTRAFLEGNEFRLARRGGVVSDSGGAAVSPGGRPLETTPTAGDRPPLKDQALYDDIRAKLVEERRQPTDADLPPELVPEVGRPIALQTLPIAEQKLVEAAFRSSQYKVKTIRGLVGTDDKIAIANQNTLEGVADDIAAELGVEHVPPPAQEGTGWRHKERDSIERKVKDKFDGDYWQVTDTTRTSFVVDTPEQAVAIIDALGKRLALIDEGWNVQPAQGYLDNKILIRHSDGRIAEVQIIGREFWTAKFKEGGHDLYYLWRETYEVGPDGITIIKNKAEYDRLQNEMAALYAAANQRSNAAFQSLSERLRPSSSTTGQGTARQRLPGDELDQADIALSPGSRVTTTGIPSQSKRPTMLSEGGESGGPVMGDIIPQRQAEGWGIGGWDDLTVSQQSDEMYRMEWTKFEREYNDNVKQLLEDDPEFTAYTESEALELRETLRENPDLEIPASRVDENGEIITEIRTAREVFEELAEEDAHTLDLFTCIRR
jgi:hypothetical protein